MEKLKSGNLFFIDCETTTNTFSVFNELLFIQIAICDFKEFSQLKNYSELKKKYINVQIYPISEVDSELKKLFRNILKDEKNQFVFFNASFDLAHLLKWLYPNKFFPGMDLFTYSKDYINGEIWDLYLLLKIIHPGYKKNSLAVWSQRLLQLQLDKSFQKSFRKHTPLKEKQKDYMKKDVEVLMYIFLQLKIENYSWINTHTQKNVYAFELYKIFIMNLLFEAIDSYFQGLTVNYSEISKLYENSFDTLLVFSKNFLKLTKIDSNLIKSGKSFEKHLKNQIPNHIWEILPRTATNLIKLSFKELEIVKNKYSIDNKIFFPFY